MLGSQIHSYSAYHTNEEPFLPARVHANKIQEVLMGVEALKATKSVGMPMRGGT